MPMQKIYLLIVILLFQFGYSQNVLVPYRVKDKWGLSDLNGKMVLNAVYEKVFIGRNLADGYYGFRKGEALGLIHNKKELLSGPYRELDVVKNKFIIAQSKGDLSANSSFTQEQFEEARKKRNAKFLFSLSGKNLYPEGFRDVRAFDSLGLSSRYKGHAKYLLFLSENYNKQRGVFAYDVDKQVITHWLLKDYYKLVIYSDSKFPNPGYRIKGNETGISDETIYAFSIVNNNIKVDSKPAPKPNRDEEYGTGNGVGNADISIGSYAGDLSVEAAPSNGKNSYDTSVKVNGNTIQFKSTQYPRIATSTEGIIEKTIKLPYETEWVKAGKLYYTITKPQGERVSLNGAAHFRTKQGNYGIVFLDTLMIKPEYSYLQPFISYSLPDSRMHFFVGKKSEINGRSQYGVIDIYQKEIIPIVYDSIFFNDNIRDNGNFVRTLSVSRLNVIKDGKHGIMDISGDEVLKPVYDSIYPKQKNYIQFRNTNFSVLKKEGKYGLHNEYVKNAVLIDPVWIKPPGYYIENY